MRARMAIVAVGLAAIIVLIVAGVWRRPNSIPTSTGAQFRAERVRSVGCDPLPQTPPLPKTLTPKAPTLDGVVHALDASLLDAHKMFLRCFSDEDDLLVTTQFGMGRWLRSTLHLYRPNPLTRALADAGAAEAEDMSALILRTYSRTLKGKLSASNGGVR